ncbi:putative disease resistance protein RGA3 isoform X3 [Panicum virgatum]|uniref:putative disease resistance protein RGA3 isoform X3 n=1 Tax=Panicum virgatum TaxID=38727 RepID=UPI0019D58B9B|nr:putative disease resistance protein RGA3 isoform X3 [Panicum virgatum]
MANPWGIEAVGSSIVIMGWLLSPVLSFLVNKFFANLSLDTSRKLRKLEIDTIPSLKETVRKVEEQRMLGEVKGKGSESDLAMLRKIENDLKSILHEAEDILDLVDYHRIEKKIKGTWLIFPRCIERIRAALLQCAKGLCWLGATLCRSGEQLPVSQRPSDSNPVMQKLRAMDIKALCQSMMRWLAETYVAACHYRDLSYEVVGVNKTNKKDDIAVDVFFLTIDGKSLRKRIEDIENIFNDLKNSPLLSQQCSSSSEIPAKSTSEKSSRQEQIVDSHIMILQKVFGRDKERKDISRKLREGPDGYGLSSNSSRPYSVIGIHGITGSGKSTLAQYVCEYEKKAQDKHFDLIMFSHVSTTFRVDKIFRDILEQITKVRPSDTERLQNIQKEVKEKLQGKRFLLVLDDLWVNNDKQMEQDILLDALDVGQSGSRILVTAQRQDAAAALGCAQEQIPIPDLEEEEYLSLFMHHARSGAIGNDTEYERIGIKIANKLRRSPISAVTVGKQLRRNTRIGFWEATANDVVLNETMGALWWSYQQLGADTRRCFAYCSTFPRGYKLKRDELVRIWIAQGFVNANSDEKGELEDVGNHYFDELLTFSFLMQVQRKFTTHDLLHELAERVAGSDFHRIDLNGSPKDIPAGVRHVFIGANNGAKVVVEKNLDFRNLRTLIIKERYTGTDRTTQPMDDLEEVFHWLFMRLKELRVLIVKLNHGPKVVSVPASIDQMKHLRYLGLRFPGDKLILPSTFSKLYHMQTIFVKRDSSYMRVSCPEDMANLIHLRHVTAWMPFPNVHRLTSLQTLTHFDVKEEQGYELKQLKHLNKLRGALRIWGLEIVGSKEEALEAQLACKQRLTKLVLRFSNDTCNPDVTAEVLEGLCPPKDLVDLTIQFYKGSRYPSWMLSRQHPDAPKHLQKLRLAFNSIRLASIPEDSELFTHLRELRISHCDWDRLPGNMEHLVSLQNLIIRGCDEMKLLPTLPQSLRMIQISYSDVLRTTCKEEGHQNWQKIQHIPEKNFFIRKLSSGGNALGHLPFLILRRCIYVGVSNCNEALTDPCYVRDSICEAEHTSGDESVSGTLGRPV